MLLWGALNTHVPSQLGKAAGIHLQVEGEEEKVNQLTAKQFT